MQFYSAGEHSLHSSWTLCSFIPDAMALLLLLPSAMKLVLPLHLLKGLPEPNGRVQVPSPGGSFPFLQSVRARYPRIGRELWLQLNKKQGSNSKEKHVSWG